jgi:hemerythrin-like domain-containing protein
MPKVGTTDPFAKLIADHRKAKALFKAIDKLSDRAENECEKLFAELSDALSQHMALEESVVYPELQKIKPARELTNEAYEEHHVAKLLLKELDGDIDDETWTAKFTVLMENIDHHIKEEEGELFPKVRKALSAKQKRNLAEAIQQGNKPPALTTTQEE